MPRARVLVLAFVLGLFALYALTGSQRATFATERAPLTASLAAPQPVSPDRFKGPAGEELARKAIENHWRYARDPQAPLPSADRVEAANGQIAFFDAAGGSLRLMGPNGDGQRVWLDGLVHAGEPAWSRDSSQLAFVADGADGRCLYKAKLNEPVAEPLACGFGDLRLLEWSPDGGRIAGSGWRGDDTAWHSWVTPAAGGAPVELAPSLPQNWSPSWLDNERIVVPGVDPAEVFRLYLIDLRHPEAAQPLTPAFGCSEDCSCDPGGGWMVFPRVSPNGQWIAFVGGETVSTGKSSCTGYYHVYVMPSGGGNPWKVGQIADTSSGVASCGPLYWAADSQRILVGGSESDHVMRMQVLNTATSERAVLNGAQGGDWWGWGWAPDGTRLVAGRDGGDGAAVSDVTLDDRWTRLAWGVEPVWSSAAAPTAADVFITGMQVTQATQTDVGDVPLVEGKRTFVRVSFRSRNGEVPGARAELTVSRNGVGKVIKPLNQGTLTARPANAGTNAEDLKDPALTFNFEIPLALTTGAVDLRARVITPASRVDPDTANNEYPPAGAPPQSVSFNNRAALTVASWRITVVRAGTDYAVDLSETTAAQAWVSSVYPVAANGIDLRDRGALPTRYVMPNGAWGLADVCDLRDAVLAACAKEKAKERVCFGWIDDGAYTSGFQGCAGTLTKTEGGKTTTYVGAVALLGRPHVVAHEMGHTLHRDHVRGCKAAKPYEDEVDEPGRLIPDVGFTVVGASDARAFWANTTDPPCAGRGTNYVSYYDLMGYAGVNTGKQWILPYTYKQLYAQLPPTATAADAGLPGASAETTARGLLVSGALYENGGGALSHFSHADLAPALLHSGGGRYRLELRDGNGAVLAARNFDPTAEAFGGEGADRPFVEALPLVAGARELVLLDGGAILARVAASNHAPTVQVTQPAGGSLADNALTVAWIGQDQDGDPLSYTVEFSADGGQSWRTVGDGLTGAQVEVDATTWAATENGLIRVIASDGLNRGEGVSAPFAVTARMPLAVILSPVDGAIVDAEGNIDLVGLGQDPEEGALPDTGLLWLIDNQTLGAGGRLSIGSLPPGTHTITLLARDSEGNTGSARVTLVSELNRHALFMPVLMR